MERSFVTTLLLMGSIIAAWTILSCNNAPKKNSIEIVHSEKQQRIYFNALMAVTENVIPESIREDSLAFLVLPLQASCPSCRKKVIDSIATNKDNLQSNQFIILTSANNYTEFEGYFFERKQQLPKVKGQVFLDSSNYAMNLHLYELKPTFYYTSRKKVYKRVSALPETVKDDLLEFFSGKRNTVK